MSYKRSYKSWIYNIPVYECDECFAEIDDSFPRVEDEENHYCIECAFKKHLISEVEYCDMVGGINSYMFAAGINPFTGKIEIVRGTSKKVKKENIYVNVRTKRNKFAWEKTETELRKDFRYKAWRNSVLERDKKCMCCNDTKKLVAHHKKKISDYPELAFDVDNGLTLCPSCHPKEHKRMRVLNYGS